MIKPSHKFYSLRVRLFALLAVLPLLCAGLFLFSFTQHRENVQSLERSLERHRLINDFFQNNAKLNQAFRAYIASPTDANRLYYENELAYSRNAISTILSDDAAADSDIRFYDLRNMLDSFEELAAEAIALLGAEDSAGIYAKTNEASRVSELMDSTFALYNNIYIESLADYTKGMVQSNRNNWFTNFMIILFVFVLMIVFLYRALNNISKSIRALSESAVEISRQNFDTPSILSSSEDELGILICEFEKMKLSMKSNLEKIIRQADLQKQLADEENKALRMESLLRETRLAALQMQINPHFLFNTLNLISRTAYFEGALLTIELMDATTDFLRYTLDKPQTNVSILDEIEFCKNYIYIQELRFQDRISFDISADEDLDDISVPALLIQPLIENSIIHGMREQRTVLRVEIEIRKLDDGVFISVKDNGNGLDLSDKEHLLQGSASGENESPRGGIGLRNVYERLELTYGDRFDFAIDAQPEQYFSVTIKIPKEPVDYEL